MTPQAIAQAISDATGLCPKCDFLSDEKSMQAVERTMDGGTFAKYVNALDMAHPEGATIPQRAEMFLRLRELWVE